jgi:hypothetical protein
MESKQRHPVNLKQYRKVDGKWQFVPVARMPRQPRSSPRSPRWRASQFQGGTFYIDFSHRGNPRISSDIASFALLILETALCHHSQPAVFRRDVS